MDAKAVMDDVQAHDFQGTEALSNLGGAQRTNCHRDFQRLLESLYNVELEPYWIDITVDGRYMHDFRVNLRQTLFAGHQCNIELSNICVI